MKYGCIVADPPWAYRSGSPWGQGTAAGQYPTMTIGDLCALPVADVAADDAVLLMWGTWPQMTEALDLVQAWGFTFLTGFPWIKIVGEPRRNLFGELQIKPMYGIGYWVRGCSEFVIVARRGNPIRPDGDFVGLLSENFGHSRKPENLYEYAEQFTGPYLELFARRPRQGWLSLGNEIDGRDIRDALAEMAAPYARCFTCRAVLPLQHCGHCGEWICHTCQTSGVHERHYAAWAARTGRDALTAIEF